MQNGAFACRMDVELARLVVRAYDPDRHRTPERGYLNRYIQEAFARLAFEIAEEYPEGEYITLVGDKSSGTAFGTTATLLYPHRFRFYPFHHKENHPGLKLIPKDQLWLIDDYVNSGNTFDNMILSLPFGRMVVIGAMNGGATKVAKQCKLHVLTDDEWDSPHRQRPGHTKG